MLFKTRLFDEILVTFVALVRERDSVRVLLMLKPPAAGGEGGAANRAQGSPLLGLICGRGTFCWHPCILRGQHILSWKRIRYICSFLWLQTVNNPYRILFANHLVLLESLLSLEFHIAELARFNLDVLQFVPEMV